MEKYRLPFYQRAGRAANIFWSGRKNAVKMPE
jgi:hypothetical protein